MMKKETTEKVGKTKKDKKIKQNNAADFRRLVLFVCFMEYQPL